MADGKTPATASSDAPYSDAYAWYVLFVMLVASIFSYIDRSILSLLVVPIKRDLMLSDTQMSLLIGFAFAIFHVTMGLPIGWLVDRTKRLNVIAIGVFFWSLMTALQGVARSFTSLFIFRMGVGVGEAALAPAVYSMMPDYFRPHRLGLAMGIYGTSISIGSGIAYILGAQVISWLDSMQAMTMPSIGIIYSWQLVFIAVGLPGFLVAFWVWTLKEAPRRGARMQVTATGETKLGVVKLSEVLVYIRKNARSYFGINFCYALVAVCGYGSNAWIPTYLTRSHGFTAVESGHWLGLVVIPAGTLGILTGGIVGDWLVRKGRENGRIIVMTLGGLVAMPFAIAFPLVASPYWSLALMFPTFFFMAFVTAGWMASMPQMMPNQMRGLALAIAVVINNLLGLGLGPLLIALVTDYGFHDEMMLNYSISIVCGSALLLAFLSCLTSIGAFSRSLRYLEKWQEDDKIN
jgi:MFS family permease